MSDATVNLNQAECLKSVSHWGFTRVHNVCNGNVVEVPWSALDYAGNIGLGGLLTVLGLVFVVLLFALVRIVWSDRF